jgi:hypothetical protein
VAILAYCIVPPRKLPPPGLAGCGGAAVRVIEAADALACWASDSPPALRRDEAAIREHHGVVASAMDDEVTPVPLRFGQSFPDDDAAATAIAADARRWHALLRHLAGHAEFGVRIVGFAEDAARDVHPPAAESGREYMAALARRQAVTQHAFAEGERIAALVRSRAGGLIAESTQEPVRGSQGGLVMAHLVAWQDVEAWRAAMHAVQDALRLDAPDARLLLSGPWPPYSFVA